MVAGSDRALVRKVREYRRRLVQILEEHPELLYRLLADPSISHKVLFVTGALKINIPLVPAWAPRRRAYRYWPVFDDFSGYI